MDTEQADVPVEQKARTMGWSPKEDFRGNPDNWVDAETFVKRGEEFIPFIKASEKKWKSEAEKLAGEVARQNQLLAAATESIEALKEFNTQAARDAARDEQRKLSAALVEAKREGNVEQEVQITEAIIESRAAIKAAERQPVKAAPTAQDAAAAAQRDPQWQAWKAENDWYLKDPVRTAVANALGAEVAADPETKHLTGRPFFDEVKRRTDERLGLAANRDAPSKVAGARSSGDGNSASSGDIRSYSALPADAKEACDRQAARLVGEGRAYKTINDWRKAYAQKYEWS